MPTTDRFFRYSRWDALPAFCGVGIVALIVATFLGFDQMPWWLMVPAFVAVMSSYLWNLQCISHNFIHNPFFANVWLNRAYSVLETLAIGVPHIFYHHYHLNHHAGDNDRKGPDGTTRDWSSIYRHGQSDEPEAFWKYCLIGFFRAEVMPVIRVAIRHGRTHIVQAIVETTALVAFWMTMAVVNGRYFIFFYLPSYYLGWVLSHAEGYLEHYGAEPDNPYASSVSSYNWVYNLLWFNNGYHQEHHWDPKMHWTRMKELHAEMEPQLRANRTRVLRGPHLTAFLEDYLASRKNDVREAPVSLRRGPREAAPSSRRRAA